MSQISTEKRLLISFAITLITGIITIVTSVVPWVHWKSSLDQCIYRNCSCILFGEHSISVFLGGPEAPCLFVTYGPILYVLFSLAFVCFHGYRYFFMRKSPSARTVLRKTGEGETLQMAIQSDDTDPLPRGFWVTLSVLSIFFTIYCLTHYIIFLAGYKQTCREYRKTLENQLGLRGSALPVIYSRLSCGGIYDFMDYLHPVPENGYRHGFIDTGFFLFVALTATFFSVISFIAASVFSVKQARQQQ